MKIYFDNIIYRLQSSGGISKYWTNLYSNINQSGKVKILEANKKRKVFLPYLIERFVDFYSLNSKKYIFHSSYYRISRSKNAINIVTVHDFVYERFKKGLRGFIHKIQKGRAINNASKIICVSHNTKKDLLKFYPHISKDKIHVIYHGVSNEFKPLKSFKKNKKKLIFIGNRNGYKNFRVVSKVLKISKNYELIIVGGGKLNTQEMFELKEINYTHHIGITDKKLNEIFNSSFALIYPSLYEGFGLPIIESLKAGCPVICNSGSSTGEIGSKYVLSGRISAKFIQSSLQKLEKEKFRKEIIKSGLIYASKFTWEKTAAQTLSVYKDSFIK